MARSIFILFFSLVAILCSLSMVYGLPFSEVVRQVMQETDEGIDDELMASTSPEVSIDSSPEESPDSPGEGVTIEDSDSPEPLTPTNGSPESSTEPVSSPSNGEDDEVCIDAAYLSNIPVEHLVHKDSFPSSVFCPLQSTLPCGTSNHMVRYNGKNLSYRQYCEIVSCEHKDNVLVNSVLSHIWEEEFHHENTVQLTMFDIRHPQSIQKLLHLAISIKRSIYKSKLFQISE